MQSNLFFQYCQKLVILSEDRKNILLAKRKGEADYDGVFSFIGGKMETIDGSLVEGMKREKDEEIGSSAVVKIWPYESRNVFFRKKDGSSMILPHIAGRFSGGTITLNEEYSEYKWVLIDELASFEPKIENVTEMTFWAKKRLDEVAEDELVVI